MVVILMGVSGVGKTTIGRMLAEQLGWALIDADDFHPPANIEKMSRGEPLSDEDRRPWLTAIRREIKAWLATGIDGIVACSALKAAYRARLMRDGEPITFVYLRGSFDLITQRMRQRQEHYMKPGMLRSQFDALEEPADALAIDVDGVPEAVAQRVRAAMGA